MESRGEQCSPASGFRSQVQLRLRQMLESGATSERDRRAEQRNEEQSRDEKQSGDEKQKQRQRREAEAEAEQRKTGSSVR